MKHRKVLFFANTDWYLYNFRQSLIRTMKEKGWHVVLLSPPGRYGEKLEQAGYRWLPFPFSTLSTNPFRELRYILRLIRLYRRERPDLVHHFTIKCVLYGSIAALFAGTDGVVNSVTGMGHVFTDSGWKMRMLRPFIRFLYRFVFSRENTRIIFQNREDYDYFAEAGIVRPSAAHLIRGSGVNTELFAPTESQRSAAVPVKVLFASRLMKEKGVDELVEAARMLQEKDVDFELHLAGDVYPENPSSLSENDLEKIQGLPWLVYHGHVSEIRKLIAECDIVALPSYREGTPRILLEAAAMEKPIVATRIAGCEGLVVDGSNGYLVPVRDVPALAEALEKLIGDGQLRREFGRKGRERILADFEESIVIDKTLSVYGELVDIGERSDPFKGGFLNT